MSEIKTLETLIRKELFNDGIVGIFVNPFYHARKSLYQNIKLYANKITGKTLDIGCGQKPYATIFESSEYIGLEIDTPEAREKKEADYFYDGSIFPFDDMFFDSIVTNQVFEHVFEPDLFLSEANRVLKTNGVFLMTVPFMWDEHEQPYDFARYSSFGIKHMLMKHGFEVLEHKKSLNDVRIILQLINAYLYKIIKINNKILKFSLLLPFILTFNILGELMYRFFPINNDMFLDNIVFARKK